VHIAVAGSSGLGRVIGVPTEPAGLLAALPNPRPGHVLLLAPAHLAAFARAQAHVAIAAHPDLRVAVLPLAHHGLTLTLIASAVLELAGSPRSWDEPGAAVQLVAQSSARSRSIVWHPRVFGLRQPVPSLSESAASLVKAFGFFAEVGTGTGLARGSRGFAPELGEDLHVAGELPPLLADQLGDIPVSTVPVTSEPGAPYLTGRSVELCGLVRPVHAPTAQPPCGICGASRPPTGCLFCGTGATQALAPAAAPA
jgi:hypothetical protein